MEGGIKNGAKYIKSLQGFDPVMVRVLSDFILQNHGVISEKAIIKILKAAKRKGLSPLDFISLVTADRLRLIRETTIKRLGVFESSSELNKLLKQISETTPSNGTVRIGMDPAETGERFWYSPGIFTDEIGLGYRGGTRQVFSFDIPDSVQGHFLFKVKRDGKGRLRSVNFRDEAQVDHYLPTPDHLIERYGERVTDRFFGMRRVRHQTFSYADAQELNANIRAFNRIVGDDSPLRIDSHFYYSAPMQGADPLALSSQRTIDRLADGFGWPMGSRDVFQVHDVGPILRSC